MTRKRATAPARQADAAPATIDRLVCQGLEARMAELEEAGLELQWPVVRARERGGCPDLEIDSPYFFLNQGVHRSFKQTAAAKGVPPTKAGRRSNYGSGDQFAVAMRNPDTKAVDVLLYSGGVLILYCNSMSAKESTECLAAVPANPAGQRGFVETAVNAATSRLNHYLSKVQEPSVIRLNRDILSRGDLARYLSEALVEAGCSYFVLDAEVEHLASDPEVARRVNDEGRVQQLEYLLRTVGEVQTRTIVRHCIEMLAAKSRTKTTSKRHTGKAPPRRTDARSPLTGRSGK